jgi:hypothetical protein
MERGGCRVLLYLNYCVGSRSIEEEEAGILFRVQACIRLSCERCNENVNRLVSMYLLLRRGVESQNQGELLRGGAIFAGFRFCLGYVLGE